MSKWRRAATLESQRIKVNTVPFTMSRISSAAGTSSRRRNQRVDIGNGSGREIIIEMRRERLTVRQRRNGRPKSENSKLGQDLVQEILISDIFPSPENEQLYRPVDQADPEIMEMARSVKALDVQEPLIITADRWIVSGHRRLVAAKLAGLAAVPCRVLDFRKDDDHARFMQLLRECNRQRIKSFDEKLREEVVSANPEVAYQALIEQREEQSQLDISILDLRGENPRCEISPAKEPFLAAIKKIIANRKKFWPLSDRQIHYALLNDPPLVHASKPGSTYRNDVKSYKALTELLTRARIVGDIPIEIIQDATRPVTLWNVYRDVQGYLHQQIEDFATTYWRDLMQSQPNHIEIIGEKNTIASIIRPVAAKYCIPVTIGRGFCSLRPRYDIAQRFYKSGKERLVLLMLSDFDPDGEEIVHSFARSLRDDFDITAIEPVKVALTTDQAEEFNLPPAMKAKTGSANYDRFALEHGDDVWELESLAPETLQQVLQDAIDAVIDIDAFNCEIAQEQADAVKLESVRSIVLNALSPTGEQREIT